MQTCPQCQTQLSLEATHCTCGASLSAQDPLLSLAFAGRFTPKERIGYGAFASVYRASQEGLSRPVALKILHPHLSQGARDRARFFQEAKNLERLQHAAFPRLYEYGTQDGICWIALEWLDGEPLSAHLSLVKTIAPQETIALFLPICEALEEAHQKKIIHRDISPKNLVLTTLASGKQTLRLIDLGLSSSTDELTIESEVSGTPQYMAPEQWQGLKSTDARSDIYSLGVVLYQCLSGHLPFEASGPKAWLIAIQGQPKPLTLPAGAPPESLRRAIYDAISRDPAQRPQSAHEFASRLIRKKKMPLRYAWMAALVPVLFLFFWVGRPTTSKASSEKRDPKMSAPAPDKPKLVTPAPASRAAVEALSTQPTSPTTQGQPPTKIPPTAKPKMTKQPSIIDGGLRDPFHP